jgi:hypothetical protein
VKKISQKHAVKRTAGERKIQQTNRTMKTIKNKKHLAAGMMIAVAASLLVTAGAGEPMKPMKGAEMLMMKPIDTQAEAEALKPGDSIAMACSMCKSVMVHNVSTQKGHIKVMTVGEKHLCPGCNSMITVVGTGKGKHDKVTHVCEKCGTDSVFCCATKPGEGATNGMQKEKEEK